MPRIHAPQALDQLATQAENAACQARFALLSELRGSTKPNEWDMVTTFKSKDFEHPLRLGLFIGPEGGLSDAEAATLKGLGFQGICLGPQVLRVETAVVAATAALKTMFHAFQQNRFRG